MRNAEDGRWAEERFILGSTEVLAEQMEGQGLSYRALATKIRKLNAPHVTSKLVRDWMSGEVEMTLRDFAMVAFALGIEVRVESVPGRNGTV